MEDPERLRRTVASLEPRVPSLARLIVERYAAESPICTGDPAILDHLHLVAAGTIRAMLRSALRAVLEPEPPDPELLRLVSERAADRADERVPLAEYMRAWQLALTVFGDELAAALGDRPDLLREVLRRSRSVHFAVERAAAEAFERRYRELLDGADVEPSRVVAALAEGRVGAAAGLARRPLPERPLVLVVEVVRAPGPGDAADRDPAADRPAERRAVRRMRARIEQALPGTWLMDLSAGGGTVVAERPGGRRACEGRTGERCTGERLDRLAAGLGAALRADAVLAAEDASGPGDVARALRTAREVLRVARARGERGRAVRAADVALELHLARESDGLPLLRAALAPLLDRPELAGTVRAYLACDMDRRAAARMLGVHPNTVDNRLARARELTGADPATARGLLTLAAVLWNGSAGNTVPGK
ncbi:helix-turn-helix domain-containing protein [Nocardiopsis potens]|uniref:helix-turn-helix domain-containing protein n=1 Tax=Nocardiopsis potens TaxID=1246458 RepID=UPI00035E48CA|nr:helix-turn-helix domain-containing protein [Nocardiopsis potens]